MTNSVAHWQKTAAKARRLARSLSGEDADRLLAYAEECEEAERAARRVSISGLLFFAGPDVRRGCGYSTGAAAQTLRKSNGAKD